MIGSEAVPFAKTGGLADVLGALPLALARLGWPTSVVIPRYRGAGTGRQVDRFPVTVGSYTASAGFYRTAMAAGAEAVLVDCPDLFDREELYAVDGVDYSDNARRFAFLVRAALEFAARQEHGPAIVHAHDWQGGLAPVYLKRLYASHPVLGGSSSVFTIHNLAYQGLFAADWLPRVDLPWDLFGIEGLEFWGRVSFLKGGINAADLVTTVSPQYAREARTSALGFGFDGILERRASDFVGILNGIDTDQWDPAHDRFLPAAFDASDVSGKEVAKRAVLAQYGIATDGLALTRPLVGMISRMVDQKGFDLVAAVEDEIAALDVSWTVLGSGERRYEDFWRRLASRHPDRIGAHIGFDEGLAHLIEAGADLFLMPSRFEPCGLNQMYSLRYGTVPVVHAVGGLLDTVRDEAQGDGATGFVFRDATPASMLSTLRRALAAFEDKARWRALQAAGMAQDNSWDRSAREYVKIYERAIGARHAGA